MVCFEASADQSRPSGTVQANAALIIHLVEPPIDGGPDGAAGIGLDLRGGAEVVGNEGAQRVGIIGGIGDDVTNALQTGQEGFGLRAVAMLARCRVDADGQAERVDGGVQLGRQASTGATDTGSLSPPFAPLASAWTFEIVLSIKTYSKSGVSARLWNSLSHTPACDQRRNLA